MDPVWEVGGPAAAAQAVCAHPPGSEYEPACEGPC